MKPPPARRIVAVVALSAAAFMLPGYTFYEVETDIGPVPLRWYDDAVTVYHDAALTPDAPSDAVLNAIKSSLAVWNEVDCGHPALINGGPVTDGAAFEINDETDSRRGANIIIFEDSETWNANHADSEWDMSQTLALTTVFHVASTGEIMNFALEMNDTPFTFGIEPTGYAFDIENTITHELGHVMGLDHTQSDVADWTQQTMYFQTEPAETLKRTLGPDDQAGFCDLYSTDWKADLPDPNAACAASTHAASPGPAALPVVAVVLMLAVASALSRRRAAVTEHERGM